MQERRLTKQERTLLALALAGGNPMSPVQLQKAVFLLQDLLPNDVLTEDGYDFVPYNYGPFSSEVYDDVRLLSRDELASVDKNTGSGYPSYAATAKGVESGNSLMNDLPQNVVAHARKIVSWVQEQSFRNLVSTIYERYPQYRVNSIFRG